MPAGSGTLRVVPLPRPGARLVGVSGVVRVGADRVTVQRHERHVVALVEDLLRPVPVVVVDVEHGDPRAGRRRDGAAAMAALLKKQYPPYSDVVAW